MEISGKIHRWTWGRDFQNSYFHLDVVLVSEDFKDGIKPRSQRVITILILVAQLPLDDFIRLLNGPGLIHLCLLPGDTQIDLEMRAEWMTALFHTPGTLLLRERTWLLAEKLGNYIFPIQQIRVSRQF